MEKLGRNDLCPCGSGLRFKRCCLEQERLLAYVWGMSVIEWRIEPNGSGSRYTFTDHGNAPPPEGADRRSEGVAGGYHQGFDILEAVMDGNPRPREPGEWERLQAAYRPLIEKLMGPAR